MTARTRSSRSLPRAARGTRTLLRATVLRATVLLGVSALATAGALLAPAAPAHAASRVDVSPAPSASGATTVTLTGSGFQYLPNAPGGVYVFFGAVSDPTTNAWAPSQGGRSGSTFSYATTSGATVLVAFSGGSSADAANGLIDANGNWTAQMTIPGAVFAGGSGNPHDGQAQTGGTIDCLQVQCGIITIGAHGNVNANNESFTPVSFVAADGSVQSGSGGQSFTDEATTIEIPVETGEESSASEAAEADAADEETSAGSGQDAVAAPQSSGDAGTPGVTTWVVLGVLAAAVLALLAAITGVVIAGRRRRAAAAPQTPTEHHTTNEGEQG